MHEKPNKRKFIVRYGLLYSLCLILSLGAGFVAASSLNQSVRWGIVWLGFSGITLFSLIVGFLTASAMYRKYSK
ncbi:MAG TPA: hypothetical protein PK854_04480 [Oscillospiraceae bacterium]|nr:hypothetical protein [Oscillospiraceae bacterium]